MRELKLQCYGSDVRMLMSHVSVGDSNKFCKFHEFFYYFEKMSKFHAIPKFGR